MDESIWFQKKKSKKVQIFMFPRMLLIHHSYTKKMETGVQTYLCLPTKGGI